MIIRKKKDMVPTPIEHCMGGEGTVMMEKLLNAPEEMQTHTRKRNGVYGYSFGQSKARNKRRSTDA